MFDQVPKQSPRRVPYAKTSLFVGVMLLISFLMAALVPSAIAAAPVASFTVEPAEPSTADTVYFNSTSTDDYNNITNWTWDMGDGTTLYGAQVTHSYADDGTYTVILNVTDNETLYDTHTTSVTVTNVGPTAGFTSAPGTPSTADTITFTDTSTDSDGTIANWTWDFGDGSAAAYTQNPTHTYADDGDYTVTLTVRDDDGATNATTATVSVSNVAPTAGFTSAPAAPSTADTITFTDTSTDSDGTIANWTWDFGDGSAAAYTQNPTHTYADDGDYTVTLTVRDDDGATDAQTATISVSNVAPTAGFTSAPGAPSTADTVTFTDSSSDPDGTIANWTWDFGDGSAAVYTQNPTHTYADDGDYTVTLTVRDDDGATDSTTATVSVSNVAPTAGFTSAPGAPSTADTVTFTDTSTDSDGTIANWTWDFGDGNTSYVQNPTHTYADDGDYTVTLTVRDDDAATDSTTATVSVSNVAPTAGFTSAPGAPSTADTVTFTDTSTDSDGTIANWTWDFGDGSAAVYTQNPTHTYADDGDYTVTLTVRDDDAATDSQTAVISVSNVAPTAGFSASTTTADTGARIDFTDSSTDPDGTIANWTWDFGDGNSSYAQNPNHTYEDDGSYTVQLTATDDDGATDTHSIVVTINNRAPASNYAASATSGTTSTTFTFNGSATDPDGTIANWTWDFSDGSANVYTQHTTHQFNATGTYVVYLNVTDDDGATDSFNRTITISTPGGGGGGGSPPLSAPGAKTALLAAHPTWRGTWEGDLYIHEGSEKVSVTIPDEKSPVSKLEVTVDGRGTFKLVVSELKSSDTPTEPEHWNLLDSFDVHVEATGGLDYELAILELRIPADLPEGVKPHQLMALHGDDGSWEPILAAPYSAEDGTIRFQAMTFGFSPFAIAIDEEAPTLDAPDAGKELEAGDLVAFSANDNRGIRSVSLTLNGKAVELESEDGAYWYVVPDDLAPGEYTARAEIEDLSRLVTTKEWTFKVAGEPAAPPAASEPETSDENHKETAESSFLPLVVLLGVLCGLVIVVRRRE